MCCMSLKIHKMRSERGAKRSAVLLIALALCVLFISASLLSSIHIFTHLNHEHDHNGPGGSCATCAHIITAGNLLKQISTTMAGIIIAIGGRFAFLSLLKPVFLNIGLSTPVNLKVRLNN